ncbi:MAG: MFS transporter [Chloroflexota bacterium]|nr:MFS transporter [Chloroflexota bacterium]
MSTGPHARQRPRRYYGWVIVWVTVLSAIASAVVINPTIGVFVKPMEETFDWNRSVIAGAVAIGTLAGGVIALVIGPIIDRFGAKWVLFTAFLIVGGLFVAWSGVTSLWQFYAVIILARMLLQGMINLTNQTVLAKWFVRLRGRALAYGNLGQRFGQGAVPVMTKLIITGAGWRWAAASLGIFAWTLTLIPVLLWMRRQPEDMGLRPDGDTPVREGASAAADDRERRPPSTEIHFTLREALRTRTFYILLAVLCITSFVNTGINFNFIPYMSDQGLTEGEVAVVILVWSLIGIPAALAAGLLVERIPVQAVLGGFQLGMAVGTLMLIWLGNLPMGLTFAVIQGTAFGGSLLAQQVILADYYGSRHLGAIRGAVLPWQMASNAIGPLAATLVFDTQGSYTIVFWAYVVMQSLVFLALLAARKPRHHAVEAAGEG